MRMQSLCNLISYAYEIGTIDNINPSIEEFNNLIENGGELSYGIKNGSSYSINFNDIDNDSNEQAYKDLRSIHPVSGIIDLVIEAIELGIVTDASADFSATPLLDYEGSYSDITKAHCFYFKINSELFDDTVYKITFDKKQHDIKNKIEYASRTSLFVDTLMKRIMAKYNILLVRKASWSSDEKPILPLNDCATGVLSGTSDSSFETDLIENQLKVLINYRDNFNNTTCSENVIDDIFINLKGNEVKYGFFNIGQSDDLEPLYDVINDDVSPDDIDSLLRIRNLINDSTVKFNIFETLRGNSDTNLSKLIKSRITEYDERINTDPKIEFTITPLSIYCNHIVEKTATYEIKSKNELYSEYTVDYHVIYNPTDAKNAKYNIYADGDIDELENGEELVLAFDDVYEIKKELNPRMSSKKYATMLYGLHKRYDNEFYKDIYFLNDSLVKLINGKLIAYDGIPDGNTFLKSQIVKGEITGNYVYIKDAIAVEAEDILGVDLLEIDTQRYVSKAYAKTCDICGHVYGANKEVWDLYRSTHLLVNDVNRRACCDNCKGTILDNGLAVIYSNGYKEYYLDYPDKLKYTDVCINCSSPEDAFIYINPLNKSRGKCKICNRYYCGKHINLETNICVNCDQLIEKKDHISNPKLLKMIKTNLDPLDVLSKNLTFNYMKDDNAIWVYSKRKNKQITYHLVTDDEEKFVHLIGKYVKRGGE